ncbi:MAG: DUF5916 domain-containing protein [Gemmatimonadaceae bacterium]
MRNARYSAAVIPPAKFDLRRLALAPRPSLALALALATGELRAQQQAGAPAAPVAPAVITRDVTGQATVRAIKLTAPITVDGKLDEDVYRRELPFGGLLQVVPRYGQEMTERSDVWITFDDKFIYLSCRCWDSAPPDEWIANELRRDTGGLRNNDHIGVMFDTFYDRRSGFAFYTNPLGARADYSVVDEGGSNTDWNPVWTSKTGRFEGGWTVEMAIPLKSIRYRPGSNQTWGVQLRRSVRRKNEWAYLTPVPQILAGPQALNRISAAGTLVGLDLPPAGRNIELKPYGVSRLTTDRLRTPAINDKAEGGVGGDLKYQVTPNFTFDATANTDFAQVEIDEQQVNLTRFSLFFPEKRDFFLEGRGIFDFARGGLGTGSTDVTDLPYLFYSRRIGLNRSRVIPIDAGGRLTGKAGPWAMGFMNIQTGDESVSQTDRTNFTVLRVKRDVLKRSAIGVMATNRSVAANDTGSNQAYGVDGSFGLAQNVSVGTYWARTNSTGVSGDDQSWQGRFDYNADRYGAKAEVLEVQRNFRPDVGFLRRTDFRRSFAELRFSPRPKTIKAVRKFTWMTQAEYVENGAGQLETRSFSGGFMTELQNSDQISIDVNRNHEFLRVPFTPAGSPASIPVGAYDFDDMGASYMFGAQRRASGTIGVRVGEFYDGTIRTLSIGSSNAFSPSRVSLNRHLSVEPTFAISRVERTAASFTTRLARTRIDYGFTPLMFASALVQYSSADRAVSSNLRFRWEYAPGSELFLVYTDERGTDDPLAPPTAVRGLRNRAFVVKVNRLLRY